MSGRVVIDFASAEGAIVRMIGLVERRGFRVSGIAMAEEADKASLTLDVQPLDPKRSLDVLALQLGRLHEVRQVSVSGTLS